MRSGDTLTIRPREVLVIDAFITPAECTEILAELEGACWHSSLVLQHGYQHRRTERVQERFRSSLTTRQEWFSSHLQDLATRISRELARTLGCNTACLEPWQATRYGPGDRFGYHLDAGSWGRTKPGERKRTYLLYLDLPKGGETHFRALNVRVKPGAGRLLAWNNLLPSGKCDHAMIHAGTKVFEGTKTTLVTWERERSFRERKG